MTRFETTRVEAPSGTGDEPERGEHTEGAPAAHVHLCGLGCPVSHVMTSPVVFSDPEITLRELSAAMEERAVRSLVLLRRDGPSAIVTEHDVMRAVATGADPDVAWAADVATTDLVALDVRDTVGQAIRSLAAYRVHHLPVREAGELVGMVSAGDVLSLVAERVSD